ncbi:hypothetical protein CRENBAI_013239, partial [Crenichthys baileyi]
SVDSRKQPAAGSLCYDFCLFFGLHDFRSHPVPVKLALLCPSRPDVMTLPPLAPRPWCPPYLLSLKLSNTASSSELLPAGLAVSLPSSPASSPPTEITSRKHQTIAYMPIHPPTLLALLKC